ncbi:MAG: hypothetical protein WD939_09715 [Dehalococcoidia bacterium]
MDDLTNRIMSVGVAFLWIFIVIVVILLAWGAPDQSIERLSDFAGYLDDHNTTEAKLIITFGGLILILLATIVVIFEVAPPEGGDTVKVQTAGGDARIGTDEVVRRLHEELSTIPSLREVEATVRSRGQKAEVSLKLQVAAEADLSATSEEACRRARALIEERMGVALTGPPEAELHYRELQVGHAALPPSSAPPPVAPAAPTSSSAPPDPRDADAAPTATAEQPAHDSPEPTREDQPTGA